MGTRKGGQNYIVEDFKYGINLLAQEVNNISKWANDLTRVELQED